VRTRPNWLLSAAPHQGRSHGLAGPGAASTKRAVRRTAVADEVVLQARHQVLQQQGGLLPLQRQGGIAQPAARFASQLDGIAPYILAPVRSLRAYHIGRRMPALPQSFDQHVHASQLLVLNVVLVVRVAAAAPPSARVQVRPVAHPGPNADRSVDCAE